MKFEDFRDFLIFLDGLSHKDFRTAHSLLLLRAMRRQLQRRDTPKRFRLTEGKDCDPSSKRKGAAPNRP